MTEERRAMILKYLDAAILAEEHMFFIAVEMGRMAKLEAQPPTSHEINEVICDVLRQARGISHRGAQVAQS